MNKDRYPIYGLVLGAGAAVAVWAGLPPTTLLFLVACPLMMFVMMRGMHSKQDNGSGHSAAKPSGSDQNSASTFSRPNRPDGSHERIHQP